MKSLKRLGVVIALTLVLGVSALAGETQAPPCAPPDPGETQAPPCATAQLTPDGSTPQSQPSTLPSSNPVDEYSISEVAMDLVRHWLSIF